MLFLTSNLKSHHICHRINQWHLHATYNNYRLWPRWPPPRVRELLDKRPGGDRPVTRNDRNFVRKEPPVISRTPHLHVPSQFGGFTVWNWFVKRLHHLNTCRPCYIAKHPPIICIYRFIYATQTHHHGRMLINSHTVIVESIQRHRTHPDNAWDTYLYDMRWYRIVSEVVTLNNKLRRDEIAQQSVM